MLKKIKVYGVLRKYTGQAEFMADVSSPHQAFSFLFCNFKGLEEKMANQLYCVQVGDKIVYHISATNTGNWPLVNVQVVATSATFR